MTRIRGAAGTTAAAGLVIAGLWLTVAAGSARADFTESFCQGGAPAAPWTLGLTAHGFAGTIDRCGQGGAYGFLLPSAGGQAPGEIEDAGVQIPSGEVLTAVSLDYHTFAAAGNADDFSIGYASGSTPTFFVDGDGGDANVGTHVSTPVPGATQLDLRMFCVNTSGCAYGGQQEIVDVGAMALTLRDTAPPTVQASGGDLVHGGVRRGRQTLSYAAASGGSGVARVTVSLGTTVLADLPQSCAVGSLRPCPPSVSGVATVDTAGVRDGTYPVVLTADDASGDPVSTQVSRIAVRNHSGVQTLLTAGPRRVRVQVRLGWRWVGAHTRLTSLGIGHLPSGARLTFSCVGRRCPFRRLSTDRGHLARFRRQLVGSRFTPGQKLTVSVSERHRTTEHARLLVRRGREPRVLRRR